MRPRQAYMLAALVAWACGQQGSGVETPFESGGKGASATDDAADAMGTVAETESKGGGPGGTATTGAEQSTAAEQGAASTESTAGTSDDPGTRFDVEANEGGPGVLGCDNTLPGDVTECTNRAPPDSFEPEVQWIYEGIDSLVTPMVANLTDDNADGSIDVDDIPDVVISSGMQSDDGTIHVLDGATGVLHFQIGPVAGWLSPSLGDIDADGLPEIVTGRGSLGLGVTLHAYEHDGTLKWTGQGMFGGAYTATALADLYNDGDVEILAGDSLYDHLGNNLWTITGYGFVVTASTAVDLDGDGDLEVTFGDKAFHHDGSPYYETSLAPGLGIFPQIGNFDDDDDPEIVVGHQQGVTMLEHDGTEKVSIPIASAHGGIFPGTVHDFDGDCISEFATCSGTLYTVYRPDLSVMWSMPVKDDSGIASGTAFDFLGDGISEAMYADEEWMFVFNGTDGRVFFQTGRQSGTAIEYPTVADIDNDGSAEIVVVSNGGGPASPSVQVIRDKQERWIQARRIWNQHTYHVTNVEEDGTIPQFELPNWKTLNTFRTNAQIEGGGVCRPSPPAE